MPRVTGAEVPLQAVEGLEEDPKVRSYAETC